MNGKGSKPRHNQNQSYRDNFDLIFKDKKDSAKMRKKQIRILEDLSGNESDYIFDSIDEELKERFR